MALQTITDDQKKKRYGATGSFDAPSLTQAPVPKPAAPGAIDYLSNVNKVATAAVNPPLAVVNTVANSDVGQGSAKTIVGGLALPFAGAIDATRGYVANKADYKLDEPYKFTDAADATLRQGTQQISGAVRSGLQAAAPLIGTGRAKTEQEIAAEQAKPKPTVVTPKPDAIGQTSPALPPGTIDRGDGTFEIQRTGQPRLFTDDPKRALAEDAAHKGTVNTIPSANFVGAPTAAPQSIAAPAVQNRGVEIGKQPTVEDRAREKAISNALHLQSEAARYGKVRGGADATNSLNALLTNDPAERAAKLAQLSASADQSRTGQALDIARIEGEGADTAKKRGVMNAQQALLANPNDPQALATFQALTGTLPAPKEPKGYEAQKLPNVTNLDGTVTEGGVVVVNKATGETQFVRDQKQQQQAFVEGQTYTDAKGKKAVYKNGKFEPVK